MHLHSPFDMSKQWQFFLIGYLAVAIVVGLYNLLNRYIKRIQFRKASKIANFTLFICNLAITLGGLTISLYALGVSKGIITMSPSESVGVSDDSPLSKILIRNDFEHFDERLTRWWKQFYES